MGTNYIAPLFVCGNCGLKLYTWEAAKKAIRYGCPDCNKNRSEK